jgi:uncharacterized protein (DUF427 family)
MPRALWKDKVIAQSDDTVVVEGNHYFPPDAVVREHLRNSATRTHCAWKGVANYYDVVVGDAVNRDAAWYYPATSAEAKSIEGRIAFWKGVRIES